MQNAARFAMICCMAFITLGCANRALFDKSISRLEAPVNPPKYQEDLISEADIAYDKSVNVSIGEKLFVIKRRKLSAHTNVLVKPPAALGDIPTESVWQGTHKFNEHNTAYTVWTSKGYKNGQIGILVNDDTNLATYAPIIQIVGAQRGKRWVVPNGLPLFGRETLAYDEWSLRYGGKRGSDFQFEIVDYRDTKEADVIQEIMISEASFYRGFVVRNVLIKGLAEPYDGVITYKATDLLKEK